MKEVKVFYYKKTDSLENVKEADSNSAKRIEIAKELSSTDGKISNELLKLQKEYDSLEEASKKN